MGGREAAAFQAGICLALGGHTARGAFLEWTATGLGTGRL